MVDVVKDSHPLLSTEKVNSYLSTAISRINAAVVVVVKLFMRDAGKPELHFHSTLQKSPPPPP